MQVRIQPVIVLSILALAIGQGPVFADEANQAKSEVHQVWDIDTMMAQAAYNISRRYNLNKDQERITREMLVEQVTKFLDTHPEIWPVVRDLTRLQLEGKAPNEEVARRLGEAALPLLMDAQEAILDGNARWREILTPEQKRLHDYDLKDMDKTFSKMVFNFNAMASGGPAEVRLFPEQRRHPDQPPRPQKPTNDFTPPPVQADVVLPQEDAWERYVRNFISDYELDNAQSESCWSILRDCKARAAAYKQAREADFEKAAGLLREAREPGQPDIVQRLKIRNWSRMDKVLREPLERIFEDLQAKLDPIPTDSQRRRVMADAEKRARWKLLRRNRTEQGEGGTAQTTSATDPKSPSPDANKPEDDKQASENAPSPNKDGDDSR